MKGTLRRYEELHKMVYIHFSNSQKIFLAFIKNYTFFRTDEFTSFSFLSKRIINFPVINKTL